MEEPRGHERPTDESAPRKVEQPVPVELPRASPPPATAPAGGRPDAANDPVADALSPVPAIAASLAIAISEAFDRAIDSPVDHPSPARARSGALLALRAAQLAGLLTAELVDRIEEATEQRPRLPAAGTALNALDGRKQSYLLYDLLISLSAAAPGVVARMDQCVLATPGMWIARRLVSNWMPSPSSIARVKATLLRPDGTTALSYTTKRRRSELSRARREFESAVAAAPVAAAQVGLAPVVRRQPRSTGEIAVFNRLFRRRVHNLLGFATRNAVAGASGYGTLSRKGLRAAGRQLMAGVLAGSTDDLYVCLQVITHLPLETLKRAPVVISQDPPMDALAWFDLRVESFDFKLFNLIEKGARPNMGTEACYEATTQTVRIMLTPFVLAAMVRLSRKVKSPMCSVAELLGETALHPRSAVLGGAGYEVTARRLQESVPALLLAADMHRWPVALATSSQFLVSRGRPAYSVCRASEIHRAVGAGYTALDWPEARALVGGDVLVGSFVTPTREALRRMFVSLSTTATATAAGGLDSDFADAVDEFNAHSAWLSALSALCFGLRKRVAYELLRSSLEKGIVVGINDKDVHATRGPSVPIPSFFAAAWKSWAKYVNTFARRLAGSEDPRALGLARQIEEWTRDERTSLGVFVIGADLQLQAAGVQSWLDHLPASLRVKENFGRHFWPYALMSQKVAQSVIDVLMRHQLDQHRAASSSDTRIRAAVETRLRAAMDSEMDELNIEVPRALA